MVHRHTPRRHDGSPPRSRARPLDPEAANFGAILQEFELPKLEIPLHHLYYSPTGRLYATGLDPRCSLAEVGLSRDAQGKAVINGVQCLDTGGQQVGEDIIWHSVNGKEYMIVTFMGGTGVDQKDCGSVGVFDPQTNAVIKIIQARRSAVAKDAPYIMYPHGISAYQDRLVVSATVHPDPANGVGNAITVIDLNSFEPIQNIVVEDAKPVGFPSSDWPDQAESQYLAGQVTHERILVNTGTTTNAADYLGRIPQGFFYIHQMIHSSPTSLDFKTGASWNPDGVTISELNATARRAHFYNLFDCSAARFVENNFLAGMYAVATSYGLGAVGSTKTGAMGVFDVYYSNLMGVLRPEDAAFVSDWDVVLGRQQTFGTAFLKRFRYIAKDGFTLGEKQWHYGMTYIGDPTLYNDWLLNKGRG